MSETEHSRRALSTNELVPRYLVTAVSASVAAIIGAAGFVTILKKANTACRTAGQCPDGVGYIIPALCGGIATATVVVALTAIFIARRADATTIERMSRHALWLVFFVMIIPGVGWPLLTMLGPGNAYGLLGLIFIAVAALPLIVAHRRRKALPAVLVLWLIAPIIALVLWQKMFLLTPLAMTLAGGWTLALGLSLWAITRERSKPDISVAPLPVD